MPFSTALIGDFIRDPAAFAVYLFYRARSLNER
jgi:hypothetical protein